MDLFNISELVLDIQSVDPELNIFFEKFEESFSESEYKLIKEIKHLERFKKVIDVIEIIKETLQEMR